MDLNNFCRNESMVEPLASNITETSKGAMDPFNACVEVDANQQQSPSNIGVQVPLSKTQKRKLRKQKELVAVNLTCASNNKKNRRKFNLSTPSPTTSSKKPRTGPFPGTYAQAVWTIKMAIIGESFPQQKLQVKETDIIKMHILDNIDKTQEAEALPQIFGSSLHNGALIVQCKNTSTVEWLRRTFHHNDKILKNNTLSVVNYSDLPKPVKVAFKTRDTFTKEPAKLLKRLDRFNPKLKAQEWCFLHKSEEPSYIRWIFEVDQKSAEEIKAAGYGAYVGLDRGIFKIINDPNVTVTPNEEKESFPSEETFSKDERGHNYSSHRRSPSGFSEGHRPYRTGSADRDFRPVLDHRSRSDYHSTCQNLLPANPADLRREDVSLYGAWESITRRGAKRDRQEHGEVQSYPSSSSTRPMSGLDRFQGRSRSGSREYRLDSHRMRSISPYPRDRSSERLAMKDDDLSEFAPRTERLEYSPWSDKHDIPPKSPSYYEESNLYESFSLFKHDEPDNDLHYSGLSSRSFRGFQSRPFGRGLSRGLGSQGQVPFLDGFSSRPRGYPSRRRSSNSYRFD